jgi:hypothetical protein
MNNELIQKMISFCKRYWVFITPLVLLVFMLLLVFSYQNASKKTTKISPTISPNQTAPIVISRQSHFIPEPTTAGKKTGQGEMQEDEREMVVWAPLRFFESDLSGINFRKQTLSDGYTQYTYDSDTRNRPTIIIVKNGVNVYQRRVMHNTIYDNTDTAPPDYIALGSKFWGSNMYTYVYLSKGIAYVVDLSTKQVLEEMVFQPTSIEQFRVYDDDPIGVLKKP